MIARQQAIALGRRRSANPAQFEIPNPKVKGVAGTDATIFEDKSGEAGSSGQSLPSSQSKVDITSSAGDDAAMDDYEDGAHFVDNEYDWRDEEERGVGERQELRALPQSLLIKRQFWT